MESVSNPSTGAIRQPAVSYTMASMTLDGRVAVITRGTRGVGAGIARELARQGVQVFVTERSAPDRASVAERIIGIRCDHRSDAEVEAAFQKILRETGGIDVLVKNVWGGYENMALRRFWWSGLSHSGLGLLAWTRDC
jgi:short-subunit dehydrogenase